MPEGPEVKRCSEVVRDFLPSNMLTEVRLVSGKMARLGLKDLDKLKLPARIVNISTRGKMIFIELQGEYSLISTLGMSGWWYPPPDRVDRTHLDEAYYRKVIDTIEKASKYLRLQLVGSNGDYVNYVDPRNFGNMHVVTQTELERRRKSLGIDFLSDSTADLLMKATIKVSEKFSKIKKPLGEVLLDQSVLAGLGNIYRAETMYLAGISPHTPVNILGIEQVEKIVMSAQHVLVTAYSGRGTMIYPLSVVAHFLGDHGDKLLEMAKGKDVNAIGRHLVYGCKTDVLGNPVSSEPIGGRTCWWVPAVQA